MPGNLPLPPDSDIASWPPPNYIDPPEQKGLPEVAWILYAAVTCFALWLRIVWPRRQKRIHMETPGRFHAEPPLRRPREDGFLFIAWLGGTVFTIAITLACTKYHVNRHAWDVPPANYVDIALMAWICELNFLLTGAFTKTLVLCSYLRILASKRSTYLKYAAISAIAFTASYTTAFILMLFFNCQPLRAYWDAYNFTSGQEYHCVNTTVVNLLAGLFAATTDLCWIAIPPAVMYQAHLERCRLETYDKTIMMAMALLGLVVFVMSICRTYYFYEVGVASDFTLQAFRVFAFAHVELQISVICASLSI